MKTLLAIAALGIGMVGIASCADLGFGEGAVWDCGPIYNPTPPAPPLIGNGPGSVVRPNNRPSRPPQVSRPPTVNPIGPNGIGWNPGPVNRPGNNGLPTGKPIR